MLLQLVAPSGTCPMEQATVFFPFEWQSPADLVEAAEIQINTCMVTVCSMLDATCSTHSRLLLRGSIIELSEFTVACNPG